MTLKMMTGLMEGSHKGELFYAEIMSSILHIYVASEMPTRHPHRGV